ncbi:uncharacterized protein akap12a [Genypterus blacodes]|uniref:uncharacterized protein akap12a n=1 Tax=Genypterus blacodes TaxID=154954 RepID=UPI003F757C04
MGKHETVTSREETVQEPQVGEEEISPGDEAVPAEMEHRQNEVKEEKLTSTSTSAQTTDTPEMKDREPSIIITTEAEILSSQEKIKVQGSPLKRLLSGSSLKKLSKKQRGRRSSESRLSDSGEHVSDQLLSSAESAGNHREESPAQPPAEAVEVEEGTWASFKKLVTPKKRMKRPSLTGEDAGSPAEEPKTSEGEQGSDHSSEEVRKRKDSSVSWEAVLCGSGRRRGRKTSDSEDELAHGEKDDNKRDGETRQGTESPREISNGASSPRQAESPSEGDGGSTWKSLKRLVTPKRKAKDEEESKDDNIQSDSDITKDESSFSIKKLIPRRKKRKSAEKQDQVSSDEADREAVSEDEDSDTPAVVPLSEFETVETEVLTETQAIIESHSEEEDALVHVPEPLLPVENLQAEAKKVPDDAKVLEEHQTTIITASNEELEDLTESSKHQQLSDIPEEGVIEDTMATPGSVTEEVARDDTIAEDLIEITSEAITALEPVDITLTDETEMISAVSQLTESSKTSGDTTPVPAEYDMQATDVLLHQVVETIAVTPTAVSLCLNDQSPERLVSSVSPQILQTNLKDEATVLERHMQSDATCIKTCLTAEELDAVNELAPMAQTESKTEVEEVVLAVTTDAIVTADITVDEVRQADVSQAQQSMKKCDSTNERQPLVECLPEENEAISTEQMSESETIGTSEVSVVESNEDETLRPGSESQDADSTVAGIDETENENVEQEIQPELEKEDHVTSQAHADDHYQVHGVADELQTTTSEKAAILNSQQISADVDVVETQNGPQESMHGQAVMASAEEVEKDISKAETDDIIASVIDNTVEEFDQTAESKEDKIKENTTDEDPQEDQVEAEDKIPEVVDDLQKLTAVHISAVHEELSSLQDLEKNVTDIPEPCTDRASSSVADEPIHEVHLTEVCAEGEKEGELPVTEATVATAQHAQVAEVTLCGLKEVVAAMADTALEQTPEMTEPRIETATNEVEVKETMETVTPIMEMTETTETAEGSMVAVMLVPTVKVEDNHRIQVQVVDVDIKSAEVVVDTVLEVGVKQAKEIIYDCHGVDMDVMNLPPTFENEKEVTTSGAKDDIAAIPETEIDKVSEMAEPLVEAVAYGLEFKEAAETVKPLMKMTNTEETAESGDAVVMKHVPSVQFEDCHRIQVQVVDVGIKSAEVALDTVLEVGLTQAEQIIDVCHKMDNTVENLFATLETEEEVISEGSKVTIQDVIQQVKESLPEMLPDSEAIQSSVQDELVNQEQEIIKPPISETQESKKAESEFAVEEHQEVTEDATGTFGERQVEDLVISSDNDAILAEQEESQDHPEKFNIPLSSEIHDKENLVETEAELTESKDGVTTEEVPMKKMNDNDIVEAQQPQNLPSQMATPDNTGIVVPPNTGLISSMGNVESPSSLSLEFKLNIQFGHAKAPVPSSPYQVQVPGPVEPEQKASATQRTEVQKQTELTEAAVRVTQTTEPEIEHDAQERAVTMSSPVLLEVGIQAVEAVEPAEQIETEEKATPSTEATEARHVVLSHTELLTETKAAEPVKKTEEELEQDVWIDAEENINTKEGKETVEHLNNHTESAICDHEWITAESAHTQEEKTEGDDFAVAPEHPETAAASNTNI